MQASDFVIGFGKVVASSIQAATKEAVFQVLGLLGFEEGDDQSAEKQTGYTGLGLVGRPLPSQVIDGVSYDADVVYVKQGDELVPVAWRDLRLNRAFVAGVKEGSIALAGYGGGFYALDLTTSNSGSKKANILTAYCPYEFDGDGVPQKAHVVFLDPEQEAVGLVHGDGFAITLDATNGITMRADATTWLNMKPGEITGVASKIVWQGNVLAGAQPASASPAALATLLPSPSVFLSSL